MPESINRRAEELYFQRNAEAINARREAEARDAIPFVREYHTLVAPAAQNLQERDFPNPSGLIDYNGERRVHWTLFKEYDVNFSAHLLGDGEVIFEGNTYRAQPFDADDLLKPVMETDVKYYMPGRVYTLTRINHALADIALLDDERIKVMGNRQYHPPPAAATNARS